MPLAACFGYLLSVRLHELSLVGNSQAGDPSMRKSSGKALLIVSSSVLAFLMMESIARVLDLPPRPLAPLPITDFRLSDNPVLSYEYRPGHTPSDRPFDESNRGFAINSAGFRDYEYAEMKPAETYRIIVLGTMDNKDCVMLS
jgi:hypothetical protein